MAARVWLRRFYLLAVTFPVLAAAALLVACEGQRDLVRLAGATMGTSYHITGYSSQGRNPDSEQLQRQIEILLETINGEFSTYLQDSSLSRFNAAPIGQWVEVPEPLIAVIEISRDIHLLSGGAFDPTVGTLVDLWGFGPGDRPAHTPTDAEISALRTVLGMQYVGVDIGAGRLQRTAPIQLDLSAIAKGYAVDRVVELLSAAGLDNLMVEIGGEIAVRGLSPRNGPWRLAIERPDGGMGRPYQSLQVRDVAVATSGDYRNFYIVDGERVSHTLDPTTGRPISHRGASVTVVSATAARADGWATALNVLGPEKGYELAERNKIAAFFVYTADGDFAHRFTQAFEPYLD